MADITLTAAFSTVLGPDQEAIKRLLTDTIEQIAQDDKSFTRAKIVFTESDERCGLTAELDPTWLYLGSRRMIGVRGYEPWALRKALNLLGTAKGKYPWDDLLSHTFPFAEITTAFQLSYDRKVRRAAIVINNEP
jgi:hypothetical protein